MVRTSNPVGLEELEFALTGETQALAVHTLFSEDGPQTPERGFIGILGSATGRRRRRLFLRRIVQQDPDWVYWGRKGLGFSHRYFSRALDLISAEPRGSGLLVVHSHPGSPSDVWTRPQPSSPDLEHERELLWHQSRALSDGAPVAAGIVGPSGGWRIREYSWRRPKTPAEAGSRRFGPRSGVHCDATIVSVLEPGHIDLHFDNSAGRTSGGGGEVESSVLIWGEEGQSRLARLRVGIVGLGGVGSILAEFAPRLGVGELVLVDYDTVKRENRNRAVGSSRGDLGRAKVLYCARVAKSAAVARRFKVLSVIGSAQEESGIRPLLDCDVILNACDDPAGRQVLDHVAYAHMIPVIDGGTTLFVDDSNGRVIGRSQVSGAGPGAACLGCTGVYTREEASLARERPELRGPNAYLRRLNKGFDSDLPRAPSVITSNGLVASLMLMRLQRIVLGFPPREKVAQQSYYIEQGELLWGQAATSCKPDCYKPTLVGLGDAHALPTGVDLNRNRN
jgi:molybdopterin-synthase adenylyltransferase